MARNAGDRISEIFGGEDEYGKWVENWKENKTQQQLYASGAFDPDSEYAKQFAELKEDGASRVDDEIGWKELVFDKPPKGAAEYRDLVNAWSANGFDLRGIDLTDDPKEFRHSNIAVRVAGDRGIDESEQPTETPVTPVTATPGSNTINAPAGSGTLSPTQQVTQANPVTTSIYGNSNSVTNAVNNSVNQTTIDASNRSSFSPGNKTFYGGRSFMNNLSGVSGVADEYQSTPIRVDADGTVRVANRPTDGFINVVNRNRLFGGNTSIGDVGSYNFFG